MFTYRKAGGEGRVNSRASASVPAAVFDSFDPLRAVRAIAPSLAGIHVSTLIAAGLLGLVLAVH